MSRIKTAVRKLSLQFFVNLTRALEVSSDELLFGSRTVWSGEHSGSADRIFEDCTKYERQILEGMIAGAKQAFLENRDYMSFLPYQMNAVRMPAAVKTRPTDK